MQNIYLLFSLVYQNSLMSLHVEVVREAFSFLFWENHLKKGQQLEEHRQLLYVL